VKSVPFFPPALFERDRETALAFLWEIGTGAAQEFTLGEAVRALEADIQRETGARHAIGCASGSAALTLALDALGVRPGDEVIVPAFGCQPIAGAVAGLGAVPVFADIDQRTLVIDTAAAAAAVTAATAAIMPVHMFSVMADMPELTVLAHRHGLKIVEDAAVAAGAALGGIPAGRWGDAGVLSFSSFKPLGTCGEGGMVLTGDDEIARKCRLLRDHGRAPGTAGAGAELTGYSSRMDELPARFLMRARTSLADRLERKAEIAGRYSKALAPLEAAGLVSLPPAGPGAPGAPAEGTWCHVYAVLTHRRDELSEHLAARGVGTHVYYPVPLPAQAAFARYAGGARFPHAETVGRTNLALPAHPGVSDQDVAYVVDAIYEFFSIVLSAKERNCPWTWTVSARNGGTTPTLLPKTRTSGASLRCPSWRPPPRSSRPIRLVWCSTCRAGTAGTCRRWRTASPR
jgi:dTDP-4-amino-4,6-dideoxygalactose transaminase